MTVGEGRCLDKQILVRQVQLWRRTATIDPRISIVASDRSDVVEFTIERDGKVVGERVLEVAGVPCVEVHAALGLGIAAAIDKTILASLGIAETSAPAEPAGVPSPARVETTPPRPFPAPVVPPARPKVDSRAVVEPPSFDTPKLTAAVEGIVLINVLPEVTLGVAPSAEVAFTRGFHARASLFITTDATVVLGSGTADTNLVAGRLDGCAAAILLDDLARLRGCAGLFVGAAFSRGVGFDDPRATTAPWVAPAVRADARWAFTEAFGILTSVDGIFPGLVPELRAENGQGRVVAAQSYPIGGVIFGLGPSVIF